MSVQDRQDRTANGAGQADPASFALGLSPASLAGAERRPSFGHALMATAHEPMAILDRSLRVLAASRAYHNLFPAAFSALQSQPFVEMRKVPWRGLALQILNDVAFGGLVAENVEIDVDVPGAEPRRMLLSARGAFDVQNPDAAVLVGLLDVTGARDGERLRDELARQHDVLLQEAHHRIANSLQIIASILLLKAHSVTSEETRTHLRDVHKRLILVAAVQRQLCSAGMLEEIEFGPYIATLCEGLARSMTEGENAVAIVTSSTGGKIKSDDAISFGLVVTELVINALKHGYPGGRTGRIEIAFAANGPDWRLSVSDDGIGRPPQAEPGHTGLGTNIVMALARHLKARVEIGTPAVGSSTSIIHAERDAVAPRGDS